MGKIQLVSSQGILLRSVWDKIPHQYCRIGTPASFFKDIGFRKSSRQLGVLTEATGASFARTREGWQKPGVCRRGLSGEGRPDNCALPQYFP